MCTDSAPSGDDGVAAPSRTAHALHPGHVTLGGPAVWDLRTANAEPDPQRLRVDEPGDRRDFAYVHVALCDLRSLVVLGPGWSGRGACVGGTTACCHSSVARRLVAVKSVKSVRGER